VQVLQAQQDLLGVQLDHRLLEAAKLGQQGGDGAAGHILQEDVERLLSLLGALQGERIDKADTKHKGIQRIGDEKVRREGVERLIRLLGALQGEGKGRGRQREWRGSMYWG
jgi:hypothetical protein